MYARRHALIGLPFRVAGRNVDFDCAWVATGGTTLCDARGTTLGAITRPAITANAIPINQRNAVQIGSEPPFGGAVAKCALLGIMP